RLVLVQPPTLEESKGKMTVQGSGAELVQQEQAVSLQGRFDVVQGASDVSGGVQHVGGDHQVVVALVETLARDGLFNVEEAIGREGVFRTVMPLCVHQEGARDIAVAVFLDAVLEPSLAELLEDDSAGATDPRADLEHTQTTAVQPSPPPVAHSGH